MDEEKKEAVSEETVKEEPKKTKPLGVMLDMVRDRLETIVLNEYYANHIPASLLEMTLESVLAEVRKLKHQEYAKLLCEDS